MGTTIGITSGVADCSFIEGNTISKFAYKLSAGSLFSLTVNIFLDINYQYAHLGEFESSTAANGGNIQRPINGGDIKSQEIMFGLQYKFN